MTGFHETIYNFTNYDGYIHIKADRGYDWMVTIQKAFGKDNPSMSGINITGFGCKEAHATIEFSNGKKVEYDFALHETSVQIKNIICIYDDHVLYNGEKRNKYTRFNNHTQIVKQLVPVKTEHKQIDLSCYTMDKLRSICIENKYDMKGCKTKQDIIYLIQSKQ